MHDDWLVEVLHDIGVYAEKNDLTWLVPLIDQAYKAALTELNPSAPIPMNRHGFPQYEKSEARDPEPRKSATLLTFPLDSMNVAWAKIVTGKG